MSKIKPKRKFATKDAAALAVATAGDDFDTAEAVGIGLVKKCCERVESPLSGMAMQVEGTIGLKFARPQFCPTAIVQPGWALASGDQGQQWGRLG